MRIGFIKNDNVFSTPRAKEKWKKKYILKTSRLAQKRFSLATDYNSRCTIVIVVPYYEIHTSNILSAGAAIGLQQDYYRSIGTSLTAAAVPFGRRQPRAPYDVCRPEKTTSAVTLCVIVKEIKTVSARR